LLNGPEWRCVCEKPLLCDRHENHCVKILFCCFAGQNKLVWEVQLSLVVHESILRWTKKFYSGWWGITKHFRTALFWGPCRCNLVVAVVAGYCRFLVVGVDVVVETGKLLFPGAFPLAVGQVGGYISILRLRVRFFMWLKSSKLGRDWTRTLLGGLWNMRNSYETYNIVQYSYETCITSMKRA